MCHCNDQIVSGLLRQSSSWLQKYPATRWNRGVEHGQGMLCQRSSQLQKDKAARISRRIAIDQKEGMRDGDTQG